MRSVGLDLARGLLMIYIIVVIHGVFWLNLLPRPYNSVLLIEMPLIFLVSGYAFALTNINRQFGSRPSYFSFVKLRVSRILIPYFIYAIACAAIVIFYRKDLNFFDVIYAWMNPWNYGQGYSVGLLNWHLWFIPIFLIITLVCPLFEFCDYLHKSTELHFVVFILLFLFLSFLDSELQTPAFYLIWTFLGYKMGCGWLINKKFFLLLSFWGLTSLLANGILFNQSLDMQNNKFPPNHLFLAFSCISVSIILFASKRVPETVIDSLSKNRVIEVFMSKGYSLFLWQGVGYSIAVSLRDAINLNVIATWLFAISFTILFGFGASSFEKLKLK